MVPAAVSELGKTQHNTKHQEGEVHALSGVEDDCHPRAPVAIRRVGVQKAGDDGVRYPPGLVDVVKTEEHAVGNPTKAPEHAFHLGQEHAPKEELLPQDRVEGGLDDEQGEEPPRALKPRKDLLRFEDRVEAVALGLRKKREE